MIGIWLSTVRAFNDNYCQANPSVPSSKDAPEGWALRFAQVVVRHGDRLTTTTPIMLVNDSVVWNCSLDQLGVPTTQDSKSTVESPARLYRLSYLPGREVYPGDCHYGQLTVRGAEQHLVLGAELRKAYVDNTKLVAGVDEIWVRSTYVQRTVNSIQANIDGMFPLEGAESDVPVVPVRTMDSQTENMLPNTVACPLLSQLYTQQNAQPFWSDFISNNVSSTMAQVHALGYLLPYTGTNALNSFTDTVWPRICHALPLPPGVTMPLFEEAWRQNTYYTMNVLWGGATTLPWAIGSFVGELVQRVSNFVSAGVSAVPAKLMLYSGHDATIVPLSNALFRTADLKWAPYASHIEIELWQAPNASFFIRTSYNGQSFVVPSCSGIFCDVNLWITSVSWVVPKNYQQECQQTTVGAINPSAHIFT